MTYLWAQLDPERRRLGAVDDQPERVVAGGDVKGLKCHAVGSYFESAIVIRRISGRDLKVLPLVGTSGHYYSNLQFLIGARAVGEVERRLDLHGDALVGTGRGVAPYARCDEKRHVVTRVADLLELIEDHFLVLYHPERGGVGAREDDQVRDCVDFQCLINLHLDSVAAESAFPRRIESRIGHHRLEALLGP